MTPWLTFAQLTALRKRHFEQVERRLGPAGRRVAQEPDMLLGVLQARSERRMRDRRRKSDRRSED